MTSTCAAEPSMELEASRLGARLARHAARRMQGLPTISILARDARSDTLQVLLAAHARSGGRAIVTAAQTLPDIVRDMLRALAEQHDLSALAQNRIAELTAEDPAQVRRAWSVKSARERALWLAHKGSLPQHRALRGPLQWLEQIELSAGVSLLARARQTVNGLEPLPALCALAEFLPLASWPLTCVTHGTLDALSSLATIAGELAALPLAALCSSAELAALDELADARTRAILKEGLLLSPAAWAAPVENRASHTLPAEPVPLALLSLERDADQLLTQAKGARALRDAAAEETDRRARSLAERLLFERLQADPLTRERFELNGQMEFRFGPRAAEIDLVSRSLRVAIEVDGYYHFTGPDAYRRDRRKDLVMQVQGFWVLRYLADDVVKQCDSVMNSIREAVLQRSALAGEEEKP